MPPKPHQSPAKNIHIYTPNPTKCTPKSSPIAQSPLKIDPFRACGPLWLKNQCLVLTQVQCLCLCQRHACPLFQRIFEAVVQDDFFAHLGGAFWAPLGALKVPLGSTLKHFGSPRISFGSFCWQCYLGNCGQPVEIAVSQLEYCNLDYFGEPCGIVFFCFCKIALKCPRWPGSTFFILLCNF